MFSFTARALALSIYSFVDSIQPTRSSIPTKMKFREMRNPQFGYFASDGSPSEGTSCELEVKGRTFNYPQSAACNGMVGTVLTRFDLDAEGRVVDAETLAAVPSRHFSDAVMDALPKLRFTHKSGSPPDCTIARKQYVFTLMFVIM
jgi:TonB family protein